MNENEVKMEELETNENLKRRNLIFFMIFVVIFFFSVFGLSYSIYKGDPSDSEITTGDIIFSYSDVDKRGNGINIYDALPMSDNIGKTLMGNGEYFDFSVTATSKKKDIIYKLLAKKLPVSTLSNNNLRIYLVSLTGSFEKQVLLTDFSNLKKEVINDNEYYVLYEKRLEKGIENYSDFYRLRMWVKEDAEDFMDKTFSLKVVAHAVSVEEGE